jgi:hypothetical protein
MAICLGLGLFPGLSLSVVIGSIQHKFVSAAYDSGFHSEFTTPFTSLSADISTATIDKANAGFTCASAFFLAITTDFPNGTFEFIQVGFADHWDWASPRAFWASAGPVLSTDFRGQYFGDLAVGSVHSYALVSIGAGWNIMFDNSLVKYIPWPYGASYVELDEETQCTLPDDAGQVNGGIATFSNVQAVWNQVSYPFFSMIDVPASSTSNSILLRYFTDEGNNGMVRSSPQAVQFGWGLPSENSFTFSPLSQPLTPSPGTFSVNFNELGLPPQYQWSVTFNGTLQTSTSSQMTFTGISAGAYSFSVYAIGYYASPSFGSVIVNGASVGKIISFTAIPREPAHQVIQHNYSYVAAGLVSVVVGVIIWNREG